MARRPNTYDADTYAEITARTARCESAETIFAALGGRIPLRTVSRIMVKVRGAPSPARPAAPPAVPARAPESDPAPATGGQPPTSSPSVDDVPDVVPPGTPEATLDAWIARLERAASLAETNGNLPALASIAAKVTALMALRHRTAPMPKPDQNERPDYAELARIGEERLLTLIRGTFKEHGRVEGS